MAVWTQHELQIPIGDPSASPDPFIPNNSTETQSVGASDTVKIKKSLKHCISKLCFVLWSIVASVLLCCLLTCLTFVVITICLLSNKILHVFDSMRGEAGKRKLFSPVSDAVASCIIVASIILLSVCLLILESWKGHTVSPGVGIAPWIKISVVILAYCALGTITRVLVLSRGRPLRPLLQGLLEAVYFGLLLPMVLLLMTFVPSWKKHTIFGLLTWKWVQATVLVVLCHTFITIVVQAGVYLSKCLCKFTTGDGFKSFKRVFYYVEGLRETVIFTLVASMHLMVWKLYFVRRINSKSFSDFGIWTFVCEVILGGLWLIKNFVLLHWEAHSVYNRPDEQMTRKLNYWYCLYELGLIDWRGNQVPEDQKNQEDQGAHKSGAERNKDNSDRCWLPPLYDIMKENAFVNTRQKIEDVSNHRRKQSWKSATEKLRIIALDRQSQGQDSQSQDSQKPDTPSQLPKKEISIHDKKKIAYAFNRSHKSLPSEEILRDLSQLWKTYISAKKISYIEKKDIQDFILHYLWKKPEEKDKSCDISSKRYQEPYEVAEQNKLSYEKSAEMLYKQLQDTNKDTKEVSAEDFLTWKDRARQNCLQLQYQLESAAGVVHFLNMVMIGLIVTLIVILWLLFTEILSTKSIVVISSPFLAATFIFGDTLKNMFRGIVYAYIMHPFSIGDLCVIAGTQMEVKTIGVWRTRFSNVATEEEVLIPNSVLESKSITNCERHPELILQDVVVFSLEKATGSEAINELQEIKSIITRPRSVLAPRPLVYTAALDQNGLTGTGIQNEEDNMRRTTFEPLGHNEDANKCSIERCKLAPAGHPGEQGTDDIMMVVKQIQDSIEVAVHFNHRKTIKDMTNAQAYDAKCIRKSEYLREIAEFKYKRTQSRCKDVVM